MSLVFLTPNFSHAQREGLFPSFKKLSYPEKCWVIKHLFIARKTFIISEKCRATAIHYKQNDSLDGDINGGQVDAFKHACWMASLAQEIRWRKAKRLGKAHEKGNYRNFKKATKKGIPVSQDKASSDMDLWNNLQGIRIGLENKAISQEKLQQIVVDSIRSGNMKIIKKNKLGEFLDKNDDVILPDQLKGNWDNGKVLVPSGYRK
ncbi:MAG: hypothetical protein K8S16_10835 [Bacteroidales bacterium]|nr:hypothetical protein [Bacteroidales bacterium]